MTLAPMRCVNVSFAQRTSMRLISEALERMTFVILRFVCEAFVVALVGAVIRLHQLPVFVARWQCESQICFETIIN